MLRLGVRDFYVLGLVFLRSGFNQSAVGGLVFLRVVVSYFYVWKL